MSDNDWVSNPTIELRSEMQPFGTKTLSEDVDTRRPDESCTAKGDGCVVMIESRVFLRECIRRSLESAFSLPVITCSAASELERLLGNASAHLVILSLIEGSNEESANACKVLSELVPMTPIIVFADKSDADLARAVIRHGAKGYIPWTMGFEIVVQVMRFVLAGGTYVSPDCFLQEDSQPAARSQRSPTAGATTRHEPAVIQPIPYGNSSKLTAYHVNAAGSEAAAGGGSPRSSSSRESPTSSTMTSRELAVIRAIQQGKSNKLIAYQLSMCESTVKAHLRNIMRKMGAKNRTDVAIKAQRILNTVGSTADAVQAA